MIRPVITTKILGWTRPTSEHVVDRFKALDLQEGSGPPQGVESMSTLSTMKAPDLSPIYLTEKQYVFPPKSHILKPKMVVFFFSENFFRFISGWSSGSSGSSRSFSGEIVFSVKGTGTL